MKICIIGTGASGWIACSILKSISFVEEIKIIGSSKIPSIGVGESTTLNFVENFLEENNFLNEFVKESDASVKYGVYYKNWGERDFIHHFKNHECFLRNKTTHNLWGQSLANKDFGVHIHDLIGTELWKFIRKNKVSLDTKEHLHSWHFDANKFSNFLMNKNIKDPKVKYIEDTIIGCKFKDKDSIDYIIGEKTERYDSDYFVNCCGDNNLNENILFEEYYDFSNILLTNKALVYPLEYKNKREEFHPYTVAKTMNHGWRWITPTQSRIGTGYVFSDQHISVDQATEELLKDIGDYTIEPKLINFSPKLNKKPFKKNNCAIGMSQGFLEPLDAPGLALSILSIDRLKNLLMGNDDIENINSNLMIEYSWWVSFILHQYKTCHRNDTRFWIDQKNVQFDFYERLIGCLPDVPEHLSERFEFMMLFHTSSGKDLQWNSKIKDMPTIIKDIDTEKVHHLDYINTYMQS